MSEARRPRLFVTRAVAPGAPLRRYFEARGYEVSGESPFGFRALAQAAMPHTDWVFAYAAKGLQLLDARHRDALRERGTPVAVMGPGTAAACEGLGLQPSYVGNGVPADVAQGFAERLSMGQQAAGGSHGDVPRVLFLHAAESMHSVERALGERIEPLRLAVYERLERDGWRLPPCEAVMLTSPSAARAVVATGTLPARVFCIGNTTAQALRDLGYVDFEIVTPTAWHH